MSTEKPTKVIVIGGYPGVGKTLIGKMLSKEARCSFFDKDTLSTEFTGKILENWGLKAGDRESQFYQDQVKRIEYDTLLKVVRENAVLGNDSICVAPFLEEFCHNPNYFHSLDSEFEQENIELNLLWVSLESAYTDAKELLRKRVETRALERDSNKLNDWENFYQALPKKPNLVHPNFYQMYNGAQYPNPERHLSSQISLVKDLFNL